MTSALPTQFTIINRQNSAITWIECRCFERDTVHDDFYELLLEEAKR